ncbi:hypothetical protein AWC38_SpisGene21236 [Stylophora pistillata]|uniref:Helicase ATP-binding domain-containing protein n=1 Tax=Stylophora pistillata TaxID=50429 RepID=A0A2B4REB6_STYPI|nr:hypothetical protein AWC38_SpisGene21236 [Stylophora pistillata]
MSKYNVNIQECAVGDNSKLTIGATDGVPRQVPTLKQGARTKPSLDDQVEYLRGKGVTAANISSYTEEEATLIEKGKISVVFGSPEAWIQNERWRTMLGNSVYSKKLCALAIDEAHVIRQWNRCTVLSSGTEAAYTGKLYGILGTPPPPSVPEGVQENLHLTEVQKQWLLTSLALENLFLPRIRKLILEEIEKENIKGEMDKSQTDFLLGRVYTLYHRPLLSWIADCDKLSELEVFRFFNHIGLTKKKWYSCSSLQLDSLLSRVEARHFHDDLRWPLSLFLKQIRLPAADIEELLEDLDNFNARGI